ncbi:MAG: glycoside hydrolase family 27 protein [Chitinophagaceae bacterium]
MIIFPGTETARYHNMPHAKRIIRKKIIAALLFVAILSGVSYAQEGKKLSTKVNSQEIALTPPMGWNSWNWFGKKEINETVVREVIDAMVKEGLRDAGYTYVVVDGGWRDTKLGPNGELLPNPVRFPHGMKVLADYAHANGLKFGLHTVPGTQDCGGDNVGGFGHEEVQFRQFLEWGLDFIKLDKCKYAEGWNEDVLKKTYFKWSDLIKKSGKNIVLNISAYTYRDWNPAVGNMSRTTPDIMAKVQGKAMFDSVPNIKNFWSVMHVAEENNKFAGFAKPGYWNDAEMLVTGDQGLSPEEQKIHFALWGIMSAPLFLGDDPRNLPQYEKDIILNRDAINIDQDPTEQGKRISFNDDMEVWAKKLKNGSAAVLLFNRNHSSPKNFQFDFSALGIRKTMKVKDVYAKKLLGKFSRSITRPIAPRTFLYLLLTP